MASAIPRRAAVQAALSLTGSGHLLIYQLGACHVLFQQPKESLDIRHVAGSSGGSVAATVVTQLRGGDLSASVPSSASVLRHHPYQQEQQHHVIDEYAQGFMHKRGRAMTLLKERLTVNVNVNNRQQHSSQLSQEVLSQSQPVLGICTTKCSDGTAHVFPFTDPIENDKELERLLTCVEASCAIPRSFHPWDVFTSQKLQYPAEDGIPISKSLDAAACVSDHYTDDNYYVDGGIAAPAPPTPPELIRIIISPVAGESPAPYAYRISPEKDSSIFRNLRLPFSLNKRDFGVHMSWQNVKALKASAGMVSTEELLFWYEQGQRDAHRFVDKVLPTIH
jgi:predicted acylesterase/phospholipase RssA